MECPYSPMVRVTAVLISMEIPILSMREWVSPMGTILRTWELDTLLPRKRVLTHLGILVWMIVLSSGWTWIRMVSLNGMGIKDRKFSAPETGQHGRFCLSYGLSLQPNQRTVNLSPGDYKFVVMHLEYGGGSGIEFRFGTPSIAFPTVVKPTDAAQAGMWSIQKLSNSKDIETQLSQLPWYKALRKTRHTTFRAHASNSQGEDWADATASFVTENKLDFNFGKITFDTTNGTWSHTSGRSGVGTIVSENWTSPTGDTLGFKKTKYTFDSIKLHGILEVEAYGFYPLSLNTVNHGDIEILVDINASGGAGTGMEARNSGNRDNFVTGGNAPGGKGILVPEAVVIRSRAMVRGVPVASPQIL